LAALSSELKPDLSADRLTTETLCITFIANYKNMNRFIFALILFSPIAFAVAQTGEIFYTHDGAIRGYDPVAFFTEQKPVKGKPDHQYVWNGATWYFSSAGNLSAFKSDPFKYAPQFGGFCAFGTAEGHKAPTQPDTWTIIDGKLYFNYNKDVQKEWNNDRDKYIDRANKNWPEVKLQE
jgi:YHS domain-containing protein